MRDLIGRGGEGELPTNGTNMNEILTQLIASAIDPAKIPALDYFDMERRDEGAFVIVLHDGVCIKVSVEQVTG